MLPVMAVARGTMGAKPQDHSRMLDGLIPVIKLRPNRTHVRPLCVHQKLLHPVHRNDLRIIVQQKHILTLCLRNPQIVHGGIIERPLKSYYLNSLIFLQFFIIIQNALFCTAVFHNNDLKIVIGGLFKNRIQAAS